METGRHYEKRRYYRHPVWAPLRYEVLVDGHKAGGLCSSDMCLMGLRFAAPEPLPESTLLRIVMTMKEQDFEIVARVEWQKQINGEKWDTGVSFLTESNAFKARMLEQVLSIEEYRLSKSAELGSEMSFESAARQWSTAYAADYSSRFPI